MQKIVIVQAGWVFVGTVGEGDAGMVTLDNAACIRVWGTTAGLGQLALHGVQKDTVLDPCGRVQFPLTSVIGMMDVKKEIKIK